MAKLEELVENEEFVEKIKATSDKSEIDAILAEYGVDQEELSVEDLENVAGGYNPVNMIKSGLTYIISTGATGQTYIDCLTCLSALAKYGLTKNSSYINSAKVTAAMNRLSALNVDVKAGVAALLGGLL